MLRNTITYSATPQTTPGTRPKPPKYLFLQYEMDVASGVTLTWLVGSLTFGVKVACGLTLQDIYIYMPEPPHFGRVLCEKQSEIFDPILSSLSVSLMM